MLAKPSARQLFCEVEGIKNAEIEMNMEDNTGRNASEELVASEPEAAPTVPTGKIDHEAEIKVSTANAVYDPECDGHSNISVAVGAKLHMDDTATYFGTANNNEAAGGSKKEEKLDLASKGKEIEDLSPSFDINLSNLQHGRDLETLDEGKCNHKMPSLQVVEYSTPPAGPSVMHSVTKPFILKDQLSEPSEKAKTNQRYRVTAVRQNPSNSLGRTKVVNTYRRKQHGERDNLLVHAVQKSTQNQKDMYVEEKRENTACVSSQVSSGFHL